LPGSSDNPTLYALGAPTVDVNGVVFAIWDGGRTYYTFDPLEAWTPRQYSILKTAPSFEFSTAQSIAVQPETGDLYTRYFGNGFLIKIDPITREGTIVAEILPPSDSFLVFDPVNPNILYIAYTHLHYIGKYNLEKKEHSNFAGTDGIGGWQDGHVTEAMFRIPHQLSVDTNGNVYVADRGNHCIRMITPDGQVSTIIGKGGVVGYQDGNSEEALLNEPKGVVVAPNGDIYITDYNNNVVRKLTKE